MNRDPKLDDIFKDAYSRSEEEPSEKVWEKLEASLDKQASERYRKKFIGWKQLSILLMFLLAGMLVYETGIFNKKEKTDNITSDNLSIQDRAFYKNKNEEKNKDDNAIKSANPTISISTSNSKNRTKNDTENSKHGLPKNNQNISKPIAKNIAQLEQKQSGNKKDLLSKNNFSKNFFTLKNEFLFQKNGNNELKDDNINELILADGNNQIIRLNKINAENTVRENLKPGELLSVKNTVAINPNLTTQKTSSKTSPIKNKSFKPFWAGSIIATNDWDGYDLDDDNDGDNLPNTTMRDYKKSIGNLERHEFSYTIGFMLTRQFKERWALKTGFTYSNTTIAIDPQMMYAVKEANGSLAYRYITSSGFSDIQPKFGLPLSVGDSLKSATAEHQLHTISIPVMVSYKLFEKNRFSIGPSIGFSANYVTKAKVETEVTDSVSQENINIGRLQGVQRLYLGFMADINLQYNFNNKLSLSLLPTLRYALTPITKKSVVETYPFGVGAGIGLNYKF